MGPLLFSVAGSLLLEGSKRVVFRKPSAMVFQDLQAGGLRHDARPLFGGNFATEVTSNTATTTVLLPILAAAAVAASVDHRLFMIPATLSASCAFMLPVATAPNAIVFGTDQVPIRSMAKAGVVLNLIGALVIAGLMVLLL